MCEMQQKHVKERSRERSRQRFHHAENVRRHSALRISRNSMTIGNEQLHQSRNEDQRRLTTCANTSRTQQTPRDQSNTILQKYPEGGGG